MSLDLTSAASPTDRFLKLDTMTLRKAPWDPCDPAAPQKILLTLVTSEPAPPVLPSTPVPAPPPTGAPLRPPRPPRQPAEPFLDDRYEVSLVGFHCRICNKDWDKLIGIKTHLVSLSSRSVLGDIVRY
ncbi:hypothetical protein RQP46_008246 [Phenoliferia psychrophenolica]